MANKLTAARNPGPFVGEPGGRLIPGDTAKASGLGGAVQHLNEGLI
ncbi:MAG: hypothetical protein M1369_06485 [Deinococcus sp.]|nr:hypothetical protein [Deinococcus sp.]MCL5965410.1 hypothetical protein [Deinococcus sp.]